MRVVEAVATRSHGDDRGTWRQTAWAELGHVWTNDANRQAPEIPIRITLALAQACQFMRLYGPRDSVSGSPGHGEDVDDGTASHCWCSSAQGLSDQYLVMPLCERCGHLADRINKHKGARER